MYCHVFQYTEMSNYLEFMKKKISMYFFQREILQFTVILYLELQKMLKQIRAIMKNIMVKSLCIILRRRH